MKRKSDYSKLPLTVRCALDNSDVEDSDALTPKECFEVYCAWHGFHGWHFWELVKACEAATADEEEKQA